MQSSLLLATDRPILDPESLQKQLYRNHPNQLFEPPQLTTFDVEEVMFYSKLVLYDFVSHTVILSSRTLEEAHFSQNISVVEKYGLCRKDDSHTSCVTAVHQSSACWRSLFVDKNKNKLYIYKKHKLNELDF